jgi:competence protein ComEA
MLLLISLFIIAIRFSVPEKNIDFMEVSGILSGNDVSISDKVEIKSADSLFPFNPNTASFNTLIKLGLASKEANTLIKYRTNGGKFRNPSDLKKIFGIDSIKTEELIPYVKLVKDTIISYKTKSYRQKWTKLDINSCDSASLVRLPGIGPVLSARIIKYRLLLGGFASVNQLKEVYGLPVETFEMIKERIFADSLSVHRIDINKAEYKDISRLPYFEKYEVQAILKYRELNGKIRKMSDLTENKLITEDKAVKVLPYLRFD